MMEILVKVDLLAFIVKFADCTSSFPPHPKDSLPDSDVMAVQSLAYTETILIFLRRYMLYGMSLDPAFSRRVDPYGHNGLNMASNNVFFSPWNLNDCQLVL